MPEEANVASRKIVATEMITIGKKRKKPRSMPRICKINDTIQASNRRSEMIESPFGAGGNPLVNKPYDTKTLPDSKKLPAEIVEYHPPVAKPITQKRADTVIRARVTIASNRSLTIILLCRCDKLHTVDC